MRSQVDALTADDKRFVARVGYIYSIDNDPAGISITLDNALSIPYYDDYNFDRPSNETPSGYASQPKGLVTGKRSRVLGTNNWIREVIYYDNEYRVLQTIRDLYDIPGSSSPTEWVTVQYNSAYLNRIDKETIQHKGLSNSTTNTIEKGYCYDHALRLKKTSLKLNALPEVTLNYFTYNDLGQVVKKGVGKKSGAGFANETEYRYHIQGMVTRINSAKFKQELYYEKKKNNSDGFYNDLIAEMYWENGSGGFKNYAYQYDKARSLTSATSSNFGYEEKGIAYDANGNIKTLQRTWNGTTLVDNLSYNYTNNNSSNQLASINDQTGNNTGYRGGSHSYEYDANGNLTKDGSRGITTAMGYNFLNLVETVSVNGKNLRYTYSASGEKLKYEVVGTSDKTVYASIAEYGNTGYLTRIQTEEGFITFNQSNSTFQFFYCLTDHLGNIRRVIDENGNVVQTNEYLALGAVVSSDTSPYSGKNRYFYQGKELQSEQVWYDFHARMYDPMTGRFNQVDGAGQFASGYIGMGNNPISYTDPDGHIAIVPLLTYSAISVVANGVVNTARDKPFFENWHSAAISGFLSGGYWNALAAGINQHMPSYGVDLGGGFSFSVSPAIAFGSNGFNFGANIGIGYSSKYFSGGLNYGMGYTNMELDANSIKGFSQRIGGGASFGGNKWNLGFYTTSFSGAGASQRVGGARLTAGKFSIAYGHL